MIAIVDYNAGNIKSVTNALTRLGAEYDLTSDPSALTAADKVILPGVGNAAQTMENLRSRGLVGVIRSLRRPVLGICVGMQIMCTSSEEGDVDCMDIFDTKVCKFLFSPDAKVPHMGWNVTSNMESRLFKGIGKESSFYYVHSFYPQLGPDTIATCRHGEVMFSAALRYENFYGTQFHPEKSGEAGETVLRNFLEL